MNSFKDNPVIFSRSHFDGNSDFNFYPLIEPTIESLNLGGTTLVDICNDAITMGKIDINLISDSLDLVWDKPPQNVYNLETMQKFQKLTDLEFKHCLLFSSLKTSKCPDTPISHKMYEVLMGNYLNNLVFTRWLYYGFMEYKEYVREQKKRKRDNHKKNLKERLNQNE